MTLGNDDAMSSQAKHRCLFCRSPLTHIFADLGTCPPSNAFLSAEQLQQPEIFHPLQAFVCEKCLLVQGPHFKRPQDIFNYDYAYYSSWSSSWVAHAKEYVAAVAERFHLNERSQIIEVGSNDGYLLQHAKALGIPCLGIDPSSGAASVAQQKGIPTITDFFTAELASRLRDSGMRADLICGINVFAHVPDINNFVEGMRIILKDGGVATMEFPHLLNLVRDVQFDTIYHEHYFYYTLAVVEKILSAHGMYIFDVEELPTHGGSLRIYAALEKNTKIRSEAVDRIVSREKEAGMQTLQYYLDFQAKIDEIKYGLMNFFIKAKREGKRVAGYGAAAKGNTLINYCGVRKDLLPFVSDASTVKQGKFLPGSRIPVFDESAIKQYKPDYILILPWNLKDEITEQLSYASDWGGKFVTAIPTLRIYPS